MTLLGLMATFFYIGLFTIGGGLVAVTIMYKPIVEGGLISAEEFYNMLAISESTPGPIGINLATYIGYNLFGVVGGIATTAATVLPSLIVIILIAKYFPAFKDKPIVQNAMGGLKPAVSGMILVAMAQVFILSVLNIPLFQETKNLVSLIRIPNALFYLGATVILFKTKLHPLIVILLGAVFGILFL